MRHLLLGAALLSSLLSSAQAQERTWTSTDGRTIEAKFLRVVGDTVLVERVTKTITIPLEKLSEADRKWVAENSKPKPGEGAADGDIERISAILEAEDPSDADGKVVERFLRTLLPTKGAFDEEVEWDVSFGSSLITADLYPKGQSEDREGKLMWFHLVFEKEGRKGFGSEKFKGYSAMGAEDAHLFVTVGRFDVRGVADADTYRDDKMIRAVIGSIDLKTFEKL